MSNIDTYLKNILSAVYGKDVRQSIHNAIKQCYSDVSNPTLNQEAFEAQVTAKLQEYLDDGTLANMTIPDGSITQDKLADDVKLGIDDGEITASKLSGVSDNSITLIDGYYVNKNTGVLTADSNYYCTDFIPVEAGNSYPSRCKYNYGHEGAVWFDADKNYISYNSTSGSCCVFTAPTNASYVIISNQYILTAKDSFFFGSDIFSSGIDCEDDELNKIIGMMASGHLSKGSVGVEQFNFVNVNRYCKIDYDNRLGHAWFPNKNYNPYSGEPVEGIYPFDFVSGAVYSHPKYNYSLFGSETSMYFVLTFFDEDGNYITSSADISTDDLPYYLTETLNYQKYEYFTLPDEINGKIVGTVLFSIGKSNSYSAMNKELICLKDEYDSTKDSDYKEYECSSEIFTKMVQSATSYSDLSSLEGKVFVALGDSYTKGMDSQLQNLCDKLGMILDNRGIVSSSVCGDTTGNRGFQPMWSRADRIVSDYTAGYEINGVTYGISDVAIINFMGGANDGFGIETWIGTGIHDTDTNHIYGAMNHIFNVLLETFTNAKVICTTQPSSYNRVVSTSVTSDETAQLMGFDSMSEALVLSDVQFSNYAMALKENAIKEVAWSYGVTVNDVFTTFPTMFNPENRSKYWSSDKLHLTASGYQIVVDSIYNTIKELFEV